MIQKTVNYKVLVVGGYGYGNFGDDALMASLHKVLIKKYLDTDITYLCREAKYYNKIIGNSKVINYSHLEANSSVDKLIYGGGTQFYSFKGVISSGKVISRITNLPYILTKIRSIFIKDEPNNNLYNKYNLFEISKQSFAVSIGLGPFISTNDKIVNLTKELFLNLDFSAVRDFRSEDYLNDWGISKYRKYADACYVLDNNNLNVSSGIKKIGVIVRDWDHTKEGNESYNGIKKLVKDLRIKDYEVSYFVYAEDIDLYWVKYLKKKGESCIIWDPLRDSIDGFMNKMTEFDFFVTGRFHGAVFATILRKPFITIGLEPKLEMVSELFSQSSFVWKQPYITDDCLTFIEQVNNNYKNVCNLIDSKVKEQKLLATSMFDELLEKML